MISEYPLALKFQVHRLDACVIATVQLLPNVCECHRLAVL